jgi:peptidoglycan/xylan/chitin deacetylase (PgdA/CDA1 family)
LFLVDTARPVVALTIDDGPVGETTPLILDALDRHGALATFFVIADRIPGNEEILNRAVAAGHELGNHMTHEESSIGLSPFNFRQRLDQAGAEIGPFYETRWFRPGGGWFNDEIVQSARQAGYETALGSVYPLDTWISSPDFVAWYVRTQVRPGSIIVLHDGEARGRRTAAALEQILPALKKKGYTVTTLSKLAEIGGR